MFILVEMPDEKNLFGRMWATRLAWDYTFSISKIQTIIVSVKDGRLRVNIFDDHDDHVNDNHRDDSDDDEYDLAPVQGVS